jgi:hypothetical protein
MEVQLITHKRMSGKFSGKNYIQILRNGKNLQINPNYVRNLEGSQRINGKQSNS